MNAPFARRTLVRSVGLVAAGGAALAAVSITTAVLAGPSPTGSASPSASMAAPRPAPPVTPKLLAKGDVPEAESPAPKLSEWGGGRTIRMDRNSRPGWCKATLVREWVQIDCQSDHWGVRPGGAIRQLAGDPKGVGVFVSSSQRSKSGQDANIVLPLRRGDDRVFQLFDYHEQVYGAWTEQGAVFEERWPAGADRPTLVLR